MKRLLRRRDFGLLWSAAVISQVGDWVLIAALPFYVYATTHSTLAAGATFLAGNLPTIVFGSFAGVFADRWNRKRLIVLGEVLQGAVLLLLLLVQSQDTLWIVYAVAFAETTIALFSSPAFQAAIPHVAGEGQLVRGNSLLSAGENVARLVGPPVAGLVMLTVSLPGVVLLDAASFFISGALLALLATPLRDARPAGDSPAMKAEAAARRVWREWWDGVRIVASERWVAALFLVPAVSLLGDGIFTALLAPFVSGVIGGSALVFGWSLTARGLGGLAGGLAFGATIKRARAARLIAPCLLLIGAIQLAMVLFPSVPMALAAMALGGITAIGIFVTISTLLQNGVPDRYRGRVFAAYSTCLALAALCGNILGGVLGDAVGISPMLGIAAALNLVAGLVALALLRGTATRRAQDGVVALPGARVAKVPVDVGD
jgi:MFS family permease